MKEIYPNFLFYIKDSYKRLLTTFFAFLTLDIFIYFIVYNLNFKKELIDGEYIYSGLSNNQITLFIILSIITLVMILVAIELIVFVYRLRKKNDEKKHC